MNIKKLIKINIKKFSKIYSKPIVSLDKDKENIIIHMEKYNISKGFYIELKDRTTGRRIEKKIESKIIFPLNEVTKITNNIGVLDFYIKFRTKKINLKKRIKYKNENQFFKITSKDEYKVFRAYCTEKGNLSIKYSIKDFDYTINYLNIYDKDKILIKGNLEILNEDIGNITNMKIIGRNRLDSQNNNFNLKFNPLNKENTKYSFEGIIDEIKSNEDILNLRIDFYIRIYDSDDIYYQNLIELSDYKDFSEDENRFLAKIETEDNIYSYYATENRNSLALWITTETAWNKSYTIAKGRTIYNKYAKKELNNKMIFFESFFGKAYSGNPKYIYETMLEMGMDKKYTFVWAYSGENKDIIPGNPIIVDRYEAGDYYKYLAQAKYWINNIIFPIHKKRENNIYLQTWHGTPLKKLGYDITIPGPEIEGRQNFYNESRNWDYLISSNKYSSEIFERAFKFNKEFLELGYPINDIFFKNNTQFIDNLKTKLNIPKDKKIILYAPTWKDDEQNESWEHYFNLEIDLERLYKEFNEDYVIILKMHHLVSEKLKISEKMKNFAIDLSKYDDIQELYIISDILITDYSSVFFDYAHSRRPILFFVPDLYHYIENVRGLYLNMEKELPGHLIKDNDGLIYSIKNIEQIKNNYKDKYDEFYERFCSICTGKSGEEIVKKIFKEYN